MFGLMLRSSHEAEINKLRAELERANSKESDAELREMKFCQSLTSHWRCSTYELCKLNKRCARPDDAYKSIEWKEPFEAREMGETAYYAGLDITFDCPFNGSGFKQHAQAYFRLGFLEACYSQQQADMAPEEHGKRHAIREQSRKVLGLERYKGQISARTLESVAQDIADTEDEARRSIAKERRRRA